MCYELGHWFGRTSQLHDSSCYCLPLLPTFSCQPDSPPVEQTQAPDWQSLPTGQATSQLPQWLLSD